MTAARRKMHRDSDKLAKKSKIIKAWKKNGWNKEYEAYCERMRPWWNLQAALKLGKAVVVSCRRR